jgi:hypothetical protein
VQRLVQLIQLAAAAGRNSLIFPFSCITNQTLLFLDSKFPQANFLFTFVYLFFFILHFYLSFSFSPKNVGFTQKKKKKIPLKMTAYSLQITTGHASRQKLRRRLENK